MPQRAPAPLLPRSLAPLLLLLTSLHAEEPKVHEKTPPKFTNALAKETSPYLLQHAHNPVNWRPWGEEAFAAARKEDKPIFLSVGYSACHWCHVMEHESFENEAIAELINKNFIAIKVDREERPDVDEIYMAAVQVVSGRGGWPMSVFMTADGKPFFGGTYYPPEDMRGRMGFKTLLNRVNDVWTKQRDDLLKDADRLTEALRTQLASRRVDAAGQLDEDFLQNTISKLYESLDPIHGGFGGAPKFPPNSTLPFLLYMRQRPAAKDTKTIDEIATLTMNKMALGGMHDQLGGGFHRYSTDERWFLPHFEKMLYDNAMLSRAYAEASIVYKNPEYERVARDVCDWVLREMTSPDGGFYSALDADSDGEEGKFYIWGKHEIEQLLGKDADLFGTIFNVSDDGNYREEGTGKRTGHSILFLSKPIAELAKDVKLDEAALREKIESWRKTLMAVRIKRIWPLLDDKVLTAWNGLMIASLARTSVALNEPRYRDAALKAAEFQLKNQRTAEGRWLATHRKGQSKLPAYLDDHAFLAMAFLELHAATKDDRWKNEAIKIVDLMDKHFADPKGGGYFFTADDHEKLLARTKDPVDKAIPSGNGWAAQALVRLWILTSDENYHAKARSLTGEFQGMMERIPHASESMLLAAAQLHDEELKRGIVQKVEIKNEPDATRGPVKAALTISSKTLKRGASIDVSVKYTVEKGFHLQPHKVPDQFLKPTTFLLSSRAVGELKDLDFPEPIEIEMPEVGKMKVYDNEIIGKAKLNISKEAPLGKVALKIEARFQACDDKECQNPVEVILSIPVEVVD